MDKKFNVEQLQNFCIITVFEHMAAAPLTIEFKNLIDELIQKKQMQEYFI